MTDLKTMTLTQVASATNIKKRTLYNMKSDGRFPVKPIPGSKPPRYRKIDIDAWLNGEY